MSTQTPLEEISPAGWLRILVTDVPLCVLDLAPVAAATSKIRIRSFELIMEKVAPDL